MSNNSKRKPSGTNEVMFKLIMIGDSGTGKSCLLTRYTKDEFAMDYNVTIGVQLASKRINVDQNYKIKLQIWDTAGQESFRAIVRSFYRNAAAIILVYNITNKESFQSLNSWIQEARQNSPKHTIFVLMGTHLDLEEQRQITKQQAESFMEREDIAMFFETSSKTALNVCRAFDEIAKQLFMNLPTKKFNYIEIPKEQKVVLEPQQIKKEDCC